MSARCGIMCLIGAFLLFCAAACGPAEREAGRASGLPDIVMGKDFEAARASSSNPTGANHDSRVIPARGRIRLADLQGSGMIAHCWFTISADDPQYLSNLILQFHWDGASAPAIDSPFGPFFALGHNECADVVSAPIAVMAGRAPYIKYQPGQAAFNCYFPMPFRKQAQIDVINRGPVEIKSFFYHIDWRRLDAIPDDALYFHACHRSEQTKVDTLPDDRNTTAEHNYVILDTQGRGHYVGCTLHVDAHEKDPGKWYEGDDMIIVDDRPLNEAILGTGSEDYFGLAWGVRRWYQSPCCGTSYHAWNQDEPEMQQYGRFSLYRWHWPDPIPFRKSIRVSIEHGHNNDAAGKYASVAYWYHDRP